MNIEALIACTSPECSDKLPVVVSILIGVLVVFGCICLGGWLGIISTLRRIISEKKSDRD